MYNLEFLPDIIHSVKAIYPVFKMHPADTCTSMGIFIVSRLQTVSRVCISMSFLSLITELELRAQVSSLITSERERGLVLARACHELTGDVYF